MSTRTRNRAARLVITDDHDHATVVRLMTRRYPTGGLRVSMTEVDEAGTEHQAPDVTVESADPTLAGHWAYVRNDDPALLRQMVESRMCDLLGNTTVIDDVPCRLAVFDADACGSLA